MFCVFVLLLEDSREDKNGRIRFYLDLLPGLTHHVAAQVIAPLQKGG